jgi:hypothetical protein
VDSGKLSALGRDDAAVPVLYAGIFDQRLKALALEGMLVSYQAVVSTRMHRLIFEQIVPGALLDFDLADLVGSIAPRSVWISHPVTPTHTAVPHSEFVKVYDHATTAFDFAGAPQALRLQGSKPNEERAGEYYRELLSR